MRDKEKIIFDFIRKHTLAVISTVNSLGYPESAVVEFSETKELEIIFDTFAAYRKYNNLQSNPWISLVIGWDNDITVQYEGIAVELQGEELKRCVDVHITKLPKAKKFLDMDMIRYFKVTPKWIRYSDLSVNPWKIFEIDYR